MMLWRMEEKRYKKGENGYGISSRRRIWDTRSLRYKRRMGETKEGNKRRGNLPKAGLLLAEEKGPPFALPSPLSPP